MRSAALKRSKPLERRTSLRNKTEIRRTTELRRSAPKKRSGGISPASPAQRAKIKDCACLVCGSHDRMTPAHVIDRGMGGCNDPLCVVPLCIRCHDLYEHDLDLLPYLEPYYRDEQMHAVGHVGLARAMRRITKEGAL